MLLKKKKIYIHLEIIHDITPPYNNKEDEWIYGAVKQKEYLELLHKFSLVYKVRKHVL